MIYNLSNNQTSGGQIPVEINEPEELTIKIDCRAGYYLKPLNIQNAILEIRRQGDTDWHDFADGAFDLTPFHGTRQIFDVRLTILPTTPKQARRKLEFYVGK